MNKLMLKFCVICLASVQFVSAAAVVERPEISGVAFGGGAGIVKFGDEGVVSGIVVGQPYAQAPTFATSSDKTTIDVRYGFWIELDALSSGPASIQSPSILLGSSISARFNASSVAIDLVMPQASRVSVRLIDMQGRQAMTPWTSHVSSGASQLEVPFFAVGTQPMLLIIQAGSIQKTYRFVPNFIK